MKLIITISSMRRYRRCAREYYYRIERGLVPQDRAEALRFGSLVHAGLEAWWSAGADRLGAAVDVVQSAPELDHFDRVKAEVLLCGYHTRWSNSELTPVAVEAEFATDLRNPTSGHASKTWRLAGKIDAIAVDPKGLHWVIEHKTSSENIGPGSQYWSRLQLDTQISTYFVGARSLGFDPVGCIYDVIGKPKLKPLKATPEESRKYTKAGTLYRGQRDNDETPEEYRDRLFDAIVEAPERYFARGEVVRLGAEELDAAHDAWQLARIIRDSQLAARWPRNPDACQRYGRMCSYWDLCTRTASEDDYSVEAPHSELTEVK